MRAAAACWIVAAACAAAPAARGEDAAAPALRASLELEAEQTAIGAPIVATLTVDLPPGVELEAAPLGPQLGPFAVLEESWGPAEARAEGERRRWTARLAAYRTGELELPALQVRARGADGVAATAETLPRAITVQSVLDPAETDPELADLKPPATIPPDWRPLVLAAGILVLLLGAAGLAWWLERRYASRLARVPQPEDPFQRTPPEVWIYAELQKLLDRRLAEDGRIDLFFAELSRLTKTYLAGRYRVDLADATTSELPERLRQAGAGEEWIEAVAALLEQCDLVKFARRRPGLEDCRDGIERAYRIVDGTKPRLAQGAA